MKEKIQRLIDFLHGLRYMSLFEQHKERKETIEVLREVQKMVIRQETIADIAYLAGQHGYYSGDSREDMQKFIALANKFENDYNKTNWDEDAEIDYISTIENFTVIELGLENPLFTSRMNMLDFAKLSGMYQHVIDVEVKPSKVEDNDTQWVSVEEANTFGVYLRYSVYAIKELNMNPSDWLADFDTLKDADNFQYFVKALLKQNPAISID
jgi:hypothetical protein